MNTKIVQNNIEIEQLREIIDNYKNLMKPHQIRKTYLQRQNAMIKSRDKVK
jgi:hypothetical protein